mgnify:CR=1 FL=1
MATTFYQVECKVRFGGCGRKQNVAWDLFREGNWPTCCANAVRESNRKATVGTVSLTTACQDLCETATGAKCKCSCGGANHGVRS